MEKKVSKRLLLEMDCIRGGVYYFVDRGSRNKYMEVTLISMGGIPAALHEKYFDVGKLVYLPELVMTRQLEKKTGERGA